MCIYMNINKPGPGPWNAFAPAWFYLYPFVGPLCPSSLAGVNQTPSSVPFWSVWFSCRPSWSLLGRRMYIFLYIYIYIYEHK